MTDLTDVNEWTARLWALTGDVELSVHQTPTNVAQIRVAAVAAASGRAAQVVIPEYLAVPPTHLARLSAMADRLETRSGPLLDLARQSLASTLGFARALSDRSAAAITSFGQSEYGAPDHGLIARAEQVLAGSAGDAITGDVTVEAPTVDARTVATLIERVLASLRVEGWKPVVREHMAARMAVSSSAREVRIRADAAFSTAQLRGLIVHEVGTHVLRADEGARQPLLLLSRGLPGYLETEEGLATHHEAQIDPRPERLRTFALRVLAAEAALHGGLATVMDRLTAHTSAETAFPIALRAKRGMADLTVPGSPLKDIVYLRGLDAVGQHLSAHPDDHSLLMAGKLGLQHLDLARDLKGEGLLTAPETRVHQLIEEARRPDPPWDR